MNWILNLIKKIKTIFKNKSKIIEGVKNSLFKKAEIEAIALERMEICMRCPLIDHEGTKCMIPGTAPCCSACGCKLSYKTRSLSSQCEDPAGPQWKAEMTSEEEDKLYADIKYNPDAEQH